MNNQRTPQKPDPRREPRITPVRRAPRAIIGASAATVVIAMAILLKPRDQQPDTFPPSGATPSISATSQHLPRAAHHRDGRATSHGSRTASSPHRTRPAKTPTSTPTHANG